MTEWAQPEFVQTKMLHFFATNIFQGAQYTGDLPQREGQPECQVPKL